MQMPATPFGWPGVPCDRIVRVLEHLRQHHRHALTLEGAARIADMEPTVFCRHFRRRVGLGFPEYVRLFRVALAMRYLLDRNRLLSEVARAAGFGSLASLERAFKRATGKSPSAFRREARAAKAPAGQIAGANAMAVSRPK